MRGDPENRSMEVERITGRGRPLTMVETWAQCFWECSAEPSGVSLSIIFLKDKSRASISHSHYPLMNNSLRGICVPSLLTCTMYMSYVDFSGFREIPAGESQFPLPECSEGRCPQGHGNVQLRDSGIRGLQKNKVLSIFHGHIRVTSTEAHMAFSLPLPSEEL